MGQIITEKNILQKVDDSIVPGSQCCQAPVDFVLGYDATISLLVEILKKIGEHNWEPRRCFFAADHFAPSSTRERIDILNPYLDFVKTVLPVSVRNLGDARCH